MTSERQQSGSDHIPRKLSTAWFAVITRDFLFLCLLNLTQSIFSSRKEHGRTLRTRLGMRSLLTLGGHCPAVCQRRLWRLVFISRLTDRQTWRLLTSGADGVAVRRISCHARLFEADSWHKPETVHRLITERRRDVVRVRRVVDGAWCNTSHWYYIPHGGTLTPSLSRCSCVYVSNVNWNIGLCISLCTAVFTCWLW